MKTNLSSYVSTAAHTVLYTVATLLVVFALCISVIRLYPNLSDIVESRIESRLGEILNADITIESLDISRNKLFSEIVVENVKITDRKNHDNAWELRKARLSVNFVKSLLSRSLRVKEISLEGLDLLVTRDGSGNFHVNQIFFLPRTNMRNGGESKYGDVHLGLLNSNIHWTDELTDTDYLFQEIDIAIDPTSRGHDVFLSGELPPSLGKSLQAYLQIEGDIRDLENTQIDFYIKTEQFRLAEIAKRLIGASSEKVTVILNSEVWGKTTGLTLNSLRGSMQAEQIVANPGNAESDLCLSDEYIQQLSMQFDWQNVERNWQFLANNIEVVTSQRDWPETQVKFELQRHSLNGKTVFAHIGAVNLGAVCNTLHTYSPHIIRIEDHLKQFRFNADIADLFVRFDLADNHQTSFQYSMQFDDAAIWLVEGDRSLHGFSGHVEGGDVGGKVMLDSNEVVIRLPEHYPNYELKFGAQGEVLWNHQGDVYEMWSDLLEIHNDDLQLHARLNAKLVGEDIYTDSQIHVTSAKANVVGDYFPLLQKTKRTKKWFMEAIHEGDVTDATILIRGNMRSFPFHQQSGVFQTQIKVENGVLEYKKDWPKLNNVQAHIAINKDHIDVTSQQASTLNSKVKKVDISIDSFLRGILKVRGIVDGPGQNLLQFLGDADLVSKKNSVVDQIALTGDSRLEFDFSRSLSKKIIRPFEVSGNIYFLGNSLKINKVGLELSEVAGEIAFDADGASSSDDLTAIVYNQPITLSMNSLGEGASELLFQGPFDLDTYLEQRYPRFSSYFSGVAPVDGRLYLPSMFKRNNPDKLNLIVKSQLSGIKSLLPVPLDKSVDESMSASLAFDQKKGAMHWKIDDLLALHFTVNTQQPFGLNVVELGPSQQFEVQDDNITIVGSVETFPVGPWLQVYKQYINASPTKFAGTTPLPALNVGIEKLQWPQWPAQKVQLVGVPQEYEYQLSVNSTLGKGRIKIPQDKKLPVSFDMQSLILQKSASSKKTPDKIDPREVRPFLFSSKQLVLNDLKFFDVVVNASSVERGIYFDLIELAAQDLTATGTGVWEQSETQEASSLFDIRMESIDVEDSLVEMGFTSSLKKGEATTHTELHWPGAPHQFDLSKMTGYSKVNIINGSVEEIDPGGAGRLLALLNLGAISSRLSLDFKDVTNKGFTFDSIKGKLNLLEGGEVITEKIKIKASAADIEISGKTNLIDKTYDQTISVIPTVSGTFTAAGAIVGGPVGAAAGMLAERFATLVGLNKVTKTEYKMTGTWEQPVIEKVSKKINNATLATQPNGN